MRLNKAKRHLPDKLPPKPHRFSLPFSRYLGDAASVLPPPPLKNAWEYAVPDNQWGMYGNDEIGDCAFADKAHILMAVTANSGSIVVPTLEQVIEMYSAVTGYDPQQRQPDGSNPTDNGAAMTDVLAYLLNTGLAGRKILGWVQIDQTSRMHFEQCAYLFGACDVGVLLPDTAMSEFDSGRSWNDVSQDGQDGHAVPYLGYGSLGETCITWSKRQPSSIPWFQKYCDEAYGLIWPEWFDEHTGLSPSHFDKDQLWADLQALKAGGGIS
jgi:hypothetical protein